MKGRTVLVFASIISIVLLNTATLYADDFVTISTNKRYFQFPDGTPFIPIGHNEDYDLSLLLDPARLDNYFAHMKEHGENLYRVLLDTQWDITRIEWRVGEFNPVLVAAIDSLIAAAEKHGIYLIIGQWCSLDEKNPFVEWAWDTHPYNKNYDKEKGLVEHSDELLTDEAAISAAKNRMRFFIERWGASQNIFAWELWNEFNVMGTVEEQNYWIQEIGSFAKNLETELYGEYHLRTASTSDPEYGTSLSGIYTSPELDFTSYHTYNLGTVEAQCFTGTPGLSSIDPIDYFEFIYRCARVVREKSAARPILGTEDFGIFDPTVIPWPFNLALQGYTKEQRDDFFIGSAWASFMGGGGGPSLRWQHLPLFWEGAPDGYRALSTGMYDAQEALKNISDSVNLTQARAVYMNNVIFANAKQIIPMVLSDGNTHLIWLLNTQPQFTRSDVRCYVPFQSLQKSSYDVTWYDVRTGAILQQNVARGPSFTLQSPPFKIFVAATVKKRGTR